jgi:hypothetical protein
LAPTNIVDENPSFLECNEAHWEHEFPYNVGHQQVNNMDCFMEFPQKNITDAEHQETVKEAAREAKMVVINNLDQESRENLKKREFHVYKRKNSKQPVVDQAKPPPLEILLPKTSKAGKVDLNFDFDGVLSKMHVNVPLREEIKIPSTKERFDAFFSGSDEPMDPLLCCKLTISGSNMVKTLLSS